MSFCCEALPFHVSFFSNPSPTGCVDDGRSRARGGGGGSRGGDGGAGGGGGALVEAHTAAVASSSSSLGANVAAGGGLTLPSLVRWIRETYDAKAVADNTARAQRTRISPYVACLNESRFFSLNFFRHRLLSLLLLFLI